MANRVAQPLFTEWRTGMPVALSDIGALPFVNIKYDYGAQGDLITNDSPAFAKAITDLSTGFNTALGNVGVGGVLYIPPGAYYLPQGIPSLTAPIVMIGAGRRATYLCAFTNGGTDKNGNVIAGGASDVTILQTASSSQKCGFWNLMVIGKGIGTPSQTFGATQPAVLINGVNNFLREVDIQGGAPPLSVPGVDCLIENMDPFFGYGSANVYSIGANWYVRNKFDHDPIAGLSTLPLSISPWASATPYVVGNIVSTQGYNIYCIKSGTSGGSAPTLQNYGNTIQDNTVQWNLLGATNYAGIFFDTNAGENHLIQCDFSGPFVNSAIVNGGNASGINGSPVTIFDACVFSGPVDVQTGQATGFTDCEFGSNITVENGYTGHFWLKGGWANAPITLTIGSGCTSYNVDANTPNVTVVVASGVAAQDRVGTFSSGAAAAGIIGEVQQNVVGQGAAIGLVSGVSTTGPSITLGPGDWDVWISPRFTGSAATTVNYLAAALNGTAGALTAGQQNINQIYGGGATLFAFGFNMTGFDNTHTPQHFLATTTLYLNFKASFTAGSCNAYGGLNARRRR